MSAFAWAVRPWWIGGTAAPARFAAAARPARRTRRRRTPSDTASEPSSALSFEQIVFRHRERVFRVALSVLGPGGEADAEDVAQEVFVRAHRSLADFRGEAALGTWLYRVAFNLAVDQLRRRRREPFERGAGIPDGPVAPGGPAEDALDTERSRLVAEMLRSLPESQRAALRLHYWMGHTVAEIAELLGAAPGTVKSWLHRGRERLREELERRKETP